MINGKIVYAYPNEFGELKEIKDSEDKDCFGMYNKIVMKINNVEYNVYISLESEYENFEQRYR